MDLVVKCQDLVNGTRAITVVIRAPHAGQVGMMKKLKMGGKSKHENVLRAITPK